MEVGFAFPALATNFWARSWSTRPQSTSHPPSKALKMVFPMVMVTWVQLARWMIGTMNSNNLWCQASLQSRTG